MAKYRLKSAHYLTGDVYLLGDAETQDRGYEMGTIVGDGTPYKVQWPTIEMEPLDDEAREMIAKEEERLRLNGAAMNPIEARPVGADEYEQNYIPGFGQRRREPKPHGAPVRSAAAAGR